MGWGRDRGGAALSVRRLERMHPGAVQIPTASPREHPPGSHAPQCIAAQCGTTVRQQKRRRAGHAARPSRLLAW